MKGWIVESSLKYRFLVIACSVLVMILGFALIRKMPVDVLPEFEPPMVEIQTEAVGLSAEEVERLITLNVEELVVSVPWLKSIHSQSIPGLSSVRLIFEPGTDVLRARQLVQENLSRAYTLPNVSKPPVMLQPLSSTRRTMMVGLSSKVLSPMEISVLAQWTIKPNLMGVPGVANVVIWGQKNRQLQVQIDPKKLKDNKLTQHQIIKTTGDALWVSQLSFLEASFPGSGGWIDTPNQRLGIRHVLPITTPKDFATLPVEGSKLRLGEVAEIVEGHPLLVGDTYLEDGSGIILVIEKFPSANSLEVARGVEKSLENLKKGLPGIDIDTNVFQLANFIDAAINNLSLALIIGLVLVIIVLFIFFYDWRAALISLASILLTVMTTAIFLYFYGTSINIMVLAGLGAALGVIIDSAIVYIENIIQRLRQRRKGSDQSTYSIIMEALYEIQSSATYATLILMLIVLPIFFIAGNLGAFSRPLAVTYILGLLASMFIALTVIPSMAYMFVKKEPLNQQNQPLGWKSYYDSRLEKTINSPRPAFAVAAVLILACLIALPFLNRTVLPTFKDKDLLVEVGGLQGMSHAEISRIMKRMSSEVRAIPGINKVVAHSGRAEGGDQIVGMHSSQIWASIDSKANFDEVLKSVKDAVSGYKGLDVDVNTYLTDTVFDVISADKEELVLRIYGSNWKILREKAEDVMKSFSKIEGLANLHVEGLIDEPVIEVTVDIDKARPHGIMPGNVRRAAATIFAGIGAGSLYEEQKVFDVVVWGTPKSRNSLKSVQEVLIDKPGGGYVRLGDVADVKIASGPSVISHESISSYIDIVANIKERNYNSVIQDVKNQLKQISFPLEYHPELKGEFAEKQAIKQTILVVGIIALIGIYFLLQAAFDSWILAGIALLAFPAALAGGVLALIFTGFSLTLGALVGFLALLGIVVRNGMMLINRYQYLEQREGVPFGLDLVMQGTRERFVPIIMTAVATAAAFLPFIFLGEIEGLEIFYPMAIVILGGLVTTTLLTLFILPLLYFLLGSRANPVSEEKTSI